MDVRPVHWRVSMHYYFAEIILGRKKFISNPQQIFILLFFKRDTWPNTSVNKQVVAAKEPGLQRGEESVVGLRKCFGECVGDPRLLGRIEVRLGHNPIGQ